MIVFLLLLIAAFGLGVALHDKIMEKYNKLKDKFIK